MKTLILFLLKIIIAICIGLQFGVTYYLFMEHLNREHPPVKVYETFKGELVI